MIRESLLPASNQAMITQRRAKGRQHGDLTKEQTLVFFGLTTGMLHTFATVVNYITFIADNTVLSAPLTNAYRAFTIVGSIMFFFVGSALYMWSLRFYLPANLAKRKWSLGLSVNLLFKDIPLFIIEICAMWQQQSFEAVVQAITFLLAMISFGYTSFSLWVVITTGAAKRVDLLHNRSRETSAQFYSPRGESLSPTYSPLTFTTASPHSPSPATFSNSQVGLLGELSMLSPITEGSFVQAPIMHLGISNRGAAFSSPMHR